MKQQRVQNQALFTKQRVKKVRIDICIIDTHISHELVEKNSLYLLYIREVLMVGMNGGICGDECKFHAWSNVPAWRTLFQAEFGAYQRLSVRHGVAMLHRSRQYQYP